MRLIDADALIYRVMGNGLKPITEQIFRKLIDDEPTIDAVEVVRGEWIEYRPPTEDYCGMVECPFCGEELVGEPTDFNYCPNCGARMKGAHEKRIEEYRDKKREERLTEREKA